MDNTLSLPNLFHERIFQVPDYQRDYAWEREHVGELLEDVGLLNAPRRHYAGTIVLCQLPDESGRMGSDGTRYATHAVVDGQQRLTTIVLLLNELSRALDAYPACAELAQGIRKNYVQTTSIDNAPIYKLALKGKADDFFKASILPEAQGTEPPEVRAAMRLWNAKTQIAEHLRRKEDQPESEHRQSLIEWHGKLTQQLHFNLYEVEKEAEVGIIFEVMNDRGKALTELEKVKNYLLYASRSIDVDESEKEALAQAVNEAWEVILESLTEADLYDPADEDQLLHMHWIIQYDPQKKNWNESKSIKRTFSLRAYAGRHTDLLGELHKYVAGLRAASFAFCDARNPLWGKAFRSFAESVRGNLRHRNAKLTRIGVIRPFLPLLMAARQRWPSEPEKYVELVELCETFAFRIYSVCGARSDYGVPAMDRLANAVAHSVDFSEDIRKIKRIYGDQGERRKFDEAMNLREPVPDYRWESLRYFLYEYEEHLAKAKGAKPRIPWEDIDSAGLKDTIEHVLPQYIGDWSHPASEHEEYWQERFTAAKHEEYVHDIGNLTLTKWNSHYSNFAFPIKKGEFGAKTADGKELRCYANAPLFQEQEVAQYADWTKESINSRRAKLLAWARERWAVDFSDVDGAEAPEVEPDEEEMDDEVEEEGAD